MSAGLRFEDLPPKAQAQLLGEQGKSEALVSEQVEKKERKPGLMDRLAGPWPGVSAGFWFLLGWAGLMWLLSFVFDAMAIGYVLLAFVSLGWAAWKALRGGKK